MINKFLKHTDDFINIEDKISYSSDTTAFHLHTQFEICIFISGSMQLFLENGVFNLSPGQVILFNVNDIHKMSRLYEDEYHRLIIHFDHNLLDFLGEEATKLLKLFNRRKGEFVNILTPNKSQLKSIINLSETLNQLLHEKPNFYQISSLTKLLDMLVIFKGVTKNSEFLENNKIKVHPKLIKILRHLDANFASDITLDTLSEEFNINKFYLSKIFKQSTGSTIHQYLIVKRIAYSKILLNRGYSVSETCYLSGFFDYSNFIKKFKRINGITPGKYKGNLKSNKTIPNQIINSGNK